MATTTHLRHREISPVTDTDKSNVRIIDEQIDGKRTAARIGVFTHTKVLRFASPSVIIIILLAFVSGFSVAQLHFRAAMVVPAAIQATVVPPVIEAAVVPDDHYAVWHPQPASGVCGGIAVDPFPPSFEPELYHRLNQGQGEGAPSGSLDNSLDLAHYETFGRAKGWRCSRGQDIRNILNKDIASSLPPGSVLEIGPFLEPAVTVPGVRYFDVLDLEGLKARAKQIGYPTTTSIRKIDFVHPTGDLGSINGTFGLVLSSHTVEHQLDLVRHLVAVSQLLQEGGYYTMIVPDKRYCFDHYIAESTIADVLDDHRADRAKDGHHKLRSVIEHRALTVANIPAIHWAAESGPKHTPNVVDRIRASLAEYDTGVKDSKYVDVHNYQFTPQSLAFLVDTLKSLGYIDLQVHRLYETVAGSNEFCIVLKRCTEQSK